MAKNGFEKLCDDIEALANAGNVRDDDPRIRDLMEAYASIEDEWEKYATYEGGRYTRNLVRGGERGRFELILLCWYTGCKRCEKLEHSIQNTVHLPHYDRLLSAILSIISLTLYSPVHDHAESHCFMKIMKGTLRETRYKPPEQNAPMEEKERTDYEQNQVGYIKSETIYIWIRILTCMLSFL